MGQSDFADVRAQKEQAEQTKVHQEIKCYFCILANILSNIGSILIK